MSPGKENAAIRSKIFDRMLLPQAPETAHSIFDNIRFFLPGQFTRHYHARERYGALEIGIEYLLLTGYVYKRMPKVPQDVIITPSVQLWVAANPEENPEGNDYYPRIGLERYDLSPIFDSKNRIHLRLQDDPGLQAHATLRHSETGDTTPVIILPIGTTHNSIRAFERLLA